VKIALSSTNGFGAWFAAVLRMDGHAVNYFLSKEQYSGVMQGIAPNPTIKFHDHRYSMEHIGYPDYSKYDVSVFDLTGRERQSSYSQTMTPTIGDGMVNCMLEEDRRFGIQTMEDAGIDVPPYESFTDVSAGKSYVQGSNKRYVYKPDAQNDPDTATTYVSRNAEDMLDNIDRLFATTKGVPFLLQEYKKGIEISCEGWFNGTDFYCLNATLEEKKFMNDNVGPNTGCAGNLVFTISPEHRLFKEGLGKAKSVLAAMGYRGMIDLNTIATDDKLWGIEWTPRFGYDASATLYNMYGGDFGTLLQRIAAGNIPEQRWRSEFGVSIRVSIPPYPTEYRAPKLKGIPVRGLDLNDDEVLRTTYLYDVMQNGTGLVCAGNSGLICCPVAVGNSPELAFSRIERRAENLLIPDKQYRTDLKESIMKRYNELVRMGWI